MTGFTKDEARLLKLAVGIVSLEQTLNNNTASPHVVTLMRERCNKSITEFNDLLLKIDFNPLIKKLEE